MNVWMLRANSGRERALFGRNRGNEGATCKEPQARRHTHLGPETASGSGDYVAASTAIGARAVQGLHRDRGLTLQPGAAALRLAPLLDIPLSRERALNVPPEELRRRQLAALTAFLMAGARTQSVALALEDAQSIVALLLQRKQFALPLKNFSLSGHLVLGCRSEKSALTAMRFIACMKITNIRFDAAALATVEVPS